MKSKMSAFNPYIVTILLFLQGTVFLAVGCAPMESDRSVRPLVEVTETQAPRPQDGEAPPVEPTVPPVVVVPPVQNDEDAVSVFFIPNPQGHQDFINLVSTAKKSINLVMFSFSVEADAQALVQAAKNKVQVRVILDRSVMTSVKNANIVKMLKAGGVHVKASSKGFSITHEKSMTIDGKTAMISTINLTGAYKTTRGVGVVSHDSEVINEFDAVFEMDWKNADTNAKKTPKLVSKKLLWSPVNSSARLVELIHSAKQSIELYVENFSAKEISQALVNAYLSGVRVRVITPLCDLMDDPFFNVPMMNFLNSKNIETKMMPGPSTAQQPYIHAKSIIVDGERTYVGSVNFSRNSLDYAREVGIIFKNVKSAQQIQDVFEQDWKNAVATPAKGVYKMCH